MSRPVSIIVWRDAKTEPPTGNLYRYVYVLAPNAGAPCVRAKWVVSEPRRFKAWAELPVLSDLTDDDVRQIDIILHALDAQAVYLGDPATRQPNLSEKFHAAADGTQEET